MAVVVALRLEKRCCSPRHDSVIGDETEYTYDLPQRQTVVSQFFQLDRLVVEGGKSVWLLYLLDIHRVRQGRSTKVIIGKARRPTKRYS